MNATYPSPRIPPDPWTHVFLAALVILLAVGVAVFSFSYAIQILLKLWGHHVSMHQVIDDPEASFEEAYCEHYRKVQEQLNADNLWKDIKLTGTLKDTPNPLDSFRVYYDEYIMHLIQALPTNIFAIKPLALEE